MDGTDFAVELERWGPVGAGPVGARPCLNLASAQQYCRAFASAHYENFSVASWLLPRPLRQDLCNIYAYCRWADDLADEIEDPSQSLKLLDWWRQQLLDCYQGQAAHPVFVALAETIQKYDIPAAPFLSLLEAFERDQTQTRYQTTAEVLDYCRCSANPVGHLVLYLGRSFNANTASLADAVCTGLQLANFLQDVARDYERGRVYLAQETLDQFGYTEDCFKQRVVDARWRSLMEAEVTRAERFLHEGAPLVAQLPRSLGFQVELFVRGGLTILQAIRAKRFDVWTERPTVEKLTKLRLVATTWLRHRFARPNGPWSLS